jgi:hypothetical protein
LLPFNPEQLEAFELQKLFLQFSPQLLNASGYFQQIM